MGTYSYIEDYIINQLDNIQVGAYKYEGYLKCINSLKSYAANVTLSFALNFFSAIPI